MSFLFVPDASLSSSSSFFRYSRFPNSCYFPRRPGRTTRMAAADDLLVVGCGVLGTLVAERWRRARPEATILCETRTRARHADLVRLGFVPRIPEDDFPADWAGASNVAVTLPPSGARSEEVEYSDPVARAAGLWRFDERRPLPAGVG